MRDSLHEDQIIRKTSMRHSSIGTEQIQKHNYARFVTSNDNNTSWQQGSIDHLRQGSRFLSLEDTWGQDYEIRHSKTPGDKITKFVY